jgi:uncharacterized protein (DUF1697 family)
MALVVFLRGVNVGGHRRFRPSELARELSAFDVVNIGATGTFVVRKPGSRAQFRAALVEKLPFDTAIALCDGRDIIRLEKQNPFGTAARSDVVRFVSVTTGRGRLRAKTPIALPDEKEWFVRVIGADGPFVFGEYRRHMKTIGYLGQLDKLLGAAVTTRGWSTMMRVARVLREDRDGG